MRGGGAAAAGGGWHGGGGNWHGGSGGGWHGGGGGWHGHDHFHDHGSVIVGIGPYWGGWYPYPYYYPYGYGYGYGYGPGYGYGYDDGGYDSGGYGGGPDVEYSERGYDYQTDLPPPADASAYWYYCPSAHGYYPDVRKCSKDWIKVPARTDREGDRQ